MSRGRWSFLVAGLTMLLWVVGSPSGAPAQTRQLIVAQGIEPWTLDAGQVTAQAIVNITSHISETLLEYDPQFTLRGHLAESWSRVAPTVWEYRLRPNVRFSNGDPLTVDDVAWSFERVMASDSKSMRKGETRYIKSIEAVAPRTVRFHTNGPVPYFDLYMLKFPIVPKKYVQSVGEAKFATNPVGTGPYRLMEWVKDDRVVLEANPTYWGSKPKVDRVVFRTIPDVSARVAAALSGQADIVADLQPAAVPQIKARPNLALVEAGSMRNMFIMYDVINQTPLRDKRVRQALNYAVNKDDLVRHVLEGYGRVLQGELVTSLYRDAHPGLKPYPFDLSRARQLLQESGYAQGFEIRMASPNGRYMLDKELAQAVAGQLGQVGVRVNVDVLEWGVYTKQQYAYTGGPLFYIGYASEPDSARMLSIFHGKHPNSYFRVAEFDAMVEAAEGEGEPARRRELTHKALEYFREEAPVLFLHQQVDLYGVNRRVSGWVPFPDQRIAVQAADLSQ